MPKILRGHKISTIAFFPVQFNPVTKQLRVYKNIDITIHGAGSTRSIYDNAHFDKFLNNFVINYIPELDKDYNIDLMIITPNEYENTLLPFKEWKEKVGIVTRDDVESAGYQWIADPTEVNWIYEGIDANIKYIYDTEPSLAPEFLLFIGETDPETPEMPTHYWFQASGTDFYYTTMDLNGTPYFEGILDLPDMHGGRISVDDNNELQIILNKIIQYEKHPEIESTDWYNHVSLTANWDVYFGTDVCDCLEEGYDVYTSENISNFLQEQNINITKINYDILCETEDQKCWH